MQGASPLRLWKKRGKRNVFQACSVGIRKIVFFLENIAQFGYVL